MNAEETRKAAKVMLAWADGKEVEIRRISEPDTWDRFVTICGTSPRWNWEEFCYRIKQCPREFWGVVDPYGKLIYLGDDESGAHSEFARRGGMVIKLREVV